MLWEGHKKLSDASSNKEQTLLAQGARGQREVRWQNSEMWGKQPVCKGEEEEVWLCIILQEHSMKAGCELIMLLVTGLLNSSSTWKRRSSSTTQRSATHTVVPTFWDQVNLRSRMGKYELADL